MTNVLLHGKEWKVGVDVWRDPVTSTVIRVGSIVCVTVSFFNHKPWKGTGSLDFNPE